MSNGLMTWDTSRKDWAARIKAGQSLIPTLPYDDERGQKALRIFKRLRIKDVVGYPTMGAACPQWVFDFVYALFGSRDAVTKRQMVTRFLLMISKKNGKSTIAAGIMLTALILNDRADGEFIILAPTKKVAENSFGPAMGMIELDPHLSDVFKANRNYRTIEHRILHSSLRVVAADADTVGGGKAIGTLVDELWLFGKVANFENILSEVEGALMSRPEGFTAFLTTQSDDEPTGQFKVILDRMRGVRDGKIIDPTSMALIYEFPDDLIAGDKWLKDESLWRIPNPSLGYGARIEFLRDGLANKCDTKAARNIFYAKHFNIQVGLKNRANSWAGADFWEKHGYKHVTFDWMMANCDVVVSGIDGGGLDDLLGLVLLGREKVTRRWVCWARAWCHEIVLDRRKDIAAKLRELEAAGVLTIVPDESNDDIIQVADVLVKVREHGLFPEKMAIGCDPAGISDISDELVRRKFTVGTTEDFGEIYPVSQGYKLQNAISTSARRVAQGTLIHEGSPLMSWCIGNAKAEVRGNGLMITKQMAGTGKIDPLMALFDAVELMTMNPEASRSVYEDRGLRMA